MRGAVRSTSLVPSTPAYQEIFKCCLWDKTRQQEAHTGLLLDDNYSATAFVLHFNAQKPFVEAFYQ